MVDSMSGASESKVFSDIPSQYRIPFPKKQFPLWRRGLVGAAYVSLGVLATSVGLASISYRLTHMTIDSGLVNGRAVRVQAPVDGKIQDFYARPGARVKAGQVLAQLMPFSQQSQDNGLLAVGANDAQQLANQTLEIRLASTQQTLALLDQQLQELNRQEEILRSVTVGVATETVDYSEAAVTAAMAQATAARNKYERFSTLLAKGAVSQQEVDELEADWRSRQAAVEQAQSEQTIAQINASAIAQQAPMQSDLKDIQSQRRRLMEDIQRQNSQLDLLALELQAQSPEPETAVNVSTSIHNVSASDSNLIPLLAPFDGVIYATNHDAGEQVNRPAALLSLLDCNALWVEALVSADQAKRIDASQPVRIQHSGYDGTIVGNVDFVTAISAGEITKARAEALVPAVPANLSGQALARVRVSMPPTQSQEQAYRFCGVGESAKLTFGTQANPMRFLSRVF
ncbi:HlyD family efflux transporter periplasmic adaptor subunit [Leptolyngbya cf. ectocarpi LEGE 11479]|uniref:HlyD family efflux transporter periplasmic adaptor subunit n=1 Tax=Leptolyngbya cf. ectocarpi LEGE 11479 TaxID=1828722 RepID=A0A928ZXK8_LEPEC|nr:HlyD family efflux transporter periplasmic adaptor subunit [Leptolyngbya ectocarpi]MBE9069243.1 HlyD family efflux transporter periplasmic adaptor subunit [Leptolyngbya cf. ectocarpi LEGE 11479]